ncbi:MAG: MarR family transcriptional regulator [Pirellulales bacterium]
MTAESLPADATLLDLLRRHGRLSIGELAEQLEVTATAVRQRLNRLMALGWIQRSIVRAGRGRPSHLYELTPLGRRQAGANFTDLALVLWQELREIKDTEVRRGLLERVCRRMAERYAGQIRGAGLQERMESLAELFRQRRIPVEVEQTGGLPVLNALSCPYPDLAEQDRSICSLERMLFSELLGESLRLAECRLDGDACCRFAAAVN